MVSQLVISRTSRNVFLKKGKWYYFVIQNSHRFRFKTLLAYWFIFSSETSTNIRIMFCCENDEKKYYNWVVTLWLFTYFLSFSFVYDEKRGELWRYFVIQISHRFRFKILSATGLFFPVRLQYIYEGRVQQLCFIPLSRFMFLLLRHMGTSICIWVITCDCSSTIFDFHLFMI